MISDFIIYFFSFVERKKNTEAKNYEFYFYKKSLKNKGSNFFCKISNNVMCQFFVDS